MDSRRVAYVGGFASKYIGGISIEDGLWHAVAVDDDWWVVPHNPQRTDDGMATTLCGIESRWLATAAEPPERQGRDGSPQSMCVLCLVHLLHAVLARQHEYEREAPVSVHERDWHAEGAG